MPILPSDYAPSNPLFRNKHFSTIYPNRFRSVRPKYPSERQRLITPDGDFIDLEVSSGNHNRVTILLHGFEGNAFRPYMIGMSNHLRDQGWDIVAMNLRGCSGEPNKTSRAYHAGEYTDLAFVIEQILAQGLYRQVSLVGFSLGGNIVLNYLARQPDIPKEVQAGVAISVPIDLQSSVRELMKWQNMVYQRDFYRKVRQKMKQKQQIYPELLPYRDIFHCRNIDDIDECYTAPFHGFRDATDYRKQTSGLYWLEQLRRPVLLLNARNDPFLTESCFPYEIASSVGHLHLLVPRYGGHCGFWMKGDVFYHERISGDFLKETSVTPW